MDIIAIPAMNVEKLTDSQLRKLTHRIGLRPLGHPALARGLTIYSRLDDERMRRLHLKFSLQMKKDMP